MRLQLIEEPMIAAVLQAHTTSSAAAQGDQLPTNVNIVEIAAQIISRLSLDPMSKTFIFSPRLLTTMVCLAVLERSRAARLLLLCSRPYMQMGIISR